MLRGSFRVAHHFGLRTVEAVASASIAKFERCLAQSGILRGRKGNVGRLLAEATVRNARKYIAKNRSSVSGIRLSFQQKPQSGCFPEFRSY